MQTTSTPSEFPSEAALAQLPSVFGAGSRRQGRRTRLTMPVLTAAAPPTKRTITLPGMPLFELRRRTWDPTPPPRISPLLGAPCRASSTAGAIPDALVPASRSDEVHPEGHGRLARVRYATLRMIELAPFGVTGTLSYRLRRRIGWPDPYNDFAAPPVAIVALQMMIPALAFIAVLWCALALKQFSDVKQGWEFEESIATDRVFQTQTVSRLATPRTPPGF